MLHEVFYWVLNMSIIASVFGCLLYTLRLLKGFPKFASYILWAIVLVRLLCPVGITSEYSLLSIISKVTGKAIVRTVPMGTLPDISQEGPQLTPELALSNSLQMATAYDPITYKSNVLEEFFKGASLLWFLIAVAAILTVTVLYYITRSELKRANHLTANIFEGNMVNTPTVFGILKPRIILPEGIDQEKLKYILVHEKVHIKRHDNIWRMLAILTACIHWFNPLSWIFLRCFLKDCELACDEAAIKTMNLEERKDYARTLLQCASADTTVFSSAFGSSRVKVRINHVLSYRRLTLFSTICFACMVIIITFLLLANGT